MPKVWTPPTPVPMVKSPVWFNLMPKVDPEIAKRVNAPVEDVKWILQVDKTDPRIQKLEQHFKTLKQKGQLQLNQKQTEYVQRYKKNLPQYANVPDALLFWRIIMKYPEAQEKYGNIGQKWIIESIVGLPLAMAKTGSDAIMEAQDVFTERQKTLNKDGNLWITNLLASASAGRALWTGVMGMAGDVLNVASPFINPETWVTSVTEWLGRDIGTIVGKVPEEYRQQISDLMVKYPKISATLGTAFDLSNLIPFLVALGKAKSATQVDDILRQVKARPATKFRGEVSQDVFEAWMNRSVVKDVAQIPVKTAKTTLRGAEKTGEFVWETAISTWVGISKPSQQAIKTTPELYKQARTWALTRETATDEVVSTLKKRLWELSDTGKEYNTIRQSTVTMPKQDFGKILDDFFKENDISKIDMPVKDRKVVQQAIDYISEYDDVLSAKNGLSLRRKLDDLADWSTEATGEGKRLIRRLRGKVDEYLGSKIPWLKDLDAKYAPEVAFLKKVKAGILNADWTIKDSAISYVSNIVGKGKEVKLDRLEQLLPWIWQKVRALKSFEEVQAISSMKTGSVARQLGGIITGSTLGWPIWLVAWFVATNPNLVAFALEKYGMAKKAIQELLKKGAKITPEEAVKVKQAVDATPKEAISTFLLWAWEQRKLIMPPKQGDSIVQRLAKSDSPTPSSTSPSVSSVVSNKQKLLPMPKSPQVESWKSSVLSQLSKEKSISAWKKVNNSIIQKLKEKKNNIVEGLKKAKVDTELESLQKIQESMPWVPSIEVPKDYTPIGGLPTWTEFEAPIISSISKTKWKLPSPDVKRPQIRGIDLGIRSNMIDSLKKEGIFTDSFFAISDKNLSNKFIEYAEQKAIKKWVPTTGKEVSMTRLLDTAKNSADTTLTPKEYVKWLDWDKGIYLRFDIGDGNKVAVNSSYTDIFFKNFDDVTFKGSNEVSPVVVYSKWKDVGIIMPIKDPYGSKEVLWDFTTAETPKVEEITNQVEPTNADIKPVKTDLKLAPKQEDYIFKQNDIPEWNVTFYTKAKGDKTYKITGLNGVQTELKINAPLIAPDKFEAFRRAIHDTAKANPDTAFQVRDFKGKVYYDSTKELSSPLETPKPTVTEGKTFEQGTFWGVKWVQPKNQSKFNQGDNFEPVRVVMNDKDARIVRYGAIRWRGLKKWFTTADNAEMKSILDELKITREEAINRSDEIKKLAREARSSKEEVILDLTKPKQSLPMAQKSDVLYSKPVEDTLIREAKKYKSADEFIKKQSLYHGTPAKLEGNKLSFGKGGIKKGGQSGGLFLTDNQNSAKTFAFGGDVYQATPEIKKQVIDLTKKEGIDKFRDFIGKSYKDFDGELIKFDKQSFDLMFPNGKADFATVAQFPELVELVVKNNKLRGIAFNEYAGGEIGKTYQILSGDIPVYTKSQLTEIWNKANKNNADDALINEAKKYKSADEFVDAQKLYHGTSQDKYKNILKTWFKTPRELAKIWNKANKK